MVANIKRMPIGRLQRRCQGHQTMVASHTAAPLGGCEMAGQSDTTPKTLPLGKGQGLTMSPTQRQAILYGGQSHTSHFAAPKRGSCMAGYHCLMPTAFLPMQHTQHITANGISSVAIQPNT